MVRDARLTLHKRTPDRDINASGSLIAPSASNLQGPISGRKREGNVSCATVLPFREKPPHDLGNYRLSCVSPVSSEQTYYYYARLAKLSNTALYGYSLSKQDIGKAQSHWKQLSDDRCLEMFADHTPVTENWPIKGLPPPGAFLISCSH